MGLIGNTRRYNFLMVQKMIIHLEAVQIVKRNDSKIKNRNTIFRNIISLFDYIKYGTNCNTIITHPYDLPFKANVLLITFQYKDIKKQVEGLRIHNQ